MSAHPSVVYRCPECENQWDVVVVIEDWGQYPYDDEDEDCPECKTTGEQL